MNRIVIITILLIVTSLLSSFQYVYEKVSMDMLTRVTRKGFVSSMSAQVYYTSEGKMVSRYVEPQEMIVSNNKKGDMFVYTSKDNTVLQKQNFLFGTDQNQLFFFLENNKNDLGLSKMGFALAQTRFEDGLKITVWTPPLHLMKDISKAELAHEKSNPVFLGYFNSKGLLLKRVYFSKYTQVASVNFPTSITQITYENAKDSIISKTTYSNFKLDKEVTEEYLNFKVPANAKVVFN